MCEREEVESLLFPPTHEYSDTAAQEVQSMIHRSPRLYDLNQSTWTLKDIQQQVSWLNGKTGKRPLSISAVSKLLKKLGARFKRGQASIHSPDLLYNQKMAKIQHAHLLNLLDPRRFPLLYEDEKTYYLREEIGKVWGSRGKKERGKRIKQEGRMSSGALLAVLMFKPGKSFPAREVRSMSRKCIASSIMLNNTIKRQSVFLSSWIIGLSIFMRMSRKTSQEVRKRLSCFLFQHMHHGKIPWRKCG